MTPGIKAFHLLDSAQSYLWVRYGKQRANDVATPEAIEDACRILSDRQQAVRQEIVSRQGASW